MLKSVALFVTGIMIGINLDAVVFVYQRVSSIVNIMISQAIQPVAFRLAAALGLVVDFGVGDEKKIRLEITKQAAACYCVEHRDLTYFSLSEALK